MAYQEHTINSMTAIPALVANFAEDLGWDRSGLVLRHPDFEGDGPGGLSFTLSATGTVLTVTCPSPGNQAYVRQPILASPAIPAGFNVDPTKLTLIGMLTPEPYIAVVIQFGYNLYRHLYIGFMEKIGNYTGGEVISGHNGLSSTRLGNISWLDNSNTHPLFRGTLSDLNNRSNCGGVHVNHPNNADKWRNFRMTLALGGSFNPAGFDGKEAMGGFGDSYNDIFVARGLNGIAGAAVLTPINLFATLPVSGDVRFIPIGRPSGIRLINIERLDPEAVTSVGDEKWHSFAAMSKRTERTMPQGVSGGTTRYREFETSFNLGYAYRSE